MYPTVASKVVLYALLPSTYSVNVPRVFDHVTAMWCQFVSVIAPELAAQDVPATVPDANPVWGVNPTVNPLACDGHPYANRLVNDET